MTRRRWLKWLMAALGVGLLAWILFYQDGAATLVQVLRKLRYTWPLLLVPLCINIVLLFFAYRISLPGRGRAMPWIVLIHVQRSASILSSLLPIGNHGGNLIKLALMRRWFSTEEIVAAAVWASIAIGMCNALGTTGPIVGLVVGVGEPWALAVLLVVNLALAVPMTTAYLLVHKGLSRRVAALVTRPRFSFVRRRRERVLAWAARLDQHLADAVGPRKVDFWHAVGLRALMQCVRVFEIWLAMKLIGVEGGLVVALLYNALSRGVSQLLSFVPGQLGVLEASAMLMFAALGFTPEAGLQLALALRFKYVVNMLVSAGALATSSSILRKYPPLPPEERAVPMTLPEPTEIS